MNSDLQSPASSLARAQRIETVAPESVSCNRPEAIAPAASLDASAEASRHKISACDPLGAPIEPMDLVLRLLGAHRSSVQSIFRQLELAEHLVREFSAEYPQHRARLSAAFVHLRWTGGSEAPTALIEAHVRELLRRIIDDRPLQLGTRAEVLKALSDISLRAPLPPEAFTAFETLFREIWGNQVSEEPLLRESSPGRTDEIVLDVQRKLCVDSRVLEPQADLQD